MAVVRLHRYEIYVHSHQAARRLMRVILNDVQAEARLRAIGPYSKGDRLARSIVGEMFEVPNGYGGRVGSRLSYAASVENGAEIHPIFPKRARWIWRFGEIGRGPSLVFYWRRIGRRVVAPHIPMSESRIGLSHPGQRGKHYLLGAVHLVARRYRMRVVP
jgi:hypothetical protein